MMKKQILTALLGISLMAFTLFWFAGCSQSHNKMQAEQGAMMDTHNDHQGDMQGNGLEFVYSADKLYACPGCPTLITDDSEKVCKKCNIQVKELSSQAVVELREKGVKGCPHYDYIVTADDTATVCPKCNMSLVSMDARAKHTH